MAHQTQAQTNMDYIVETSFSETLSWLSVIADKQRSPGIISIELTDGGLLIIQGPNTHPIKIDLNKLPAHNSDSGRMASMFEAIAKKIREVTSTEVPQTHMRSLLEIINVL